MKSKNIINQKMIILILFLLTIYIIFNVNFKKQHQKMMTISEIIEFNIKLYLIRNAGLIDIKENGSKMLETLTSDEILIKFHRRLYQKYKSKYIKTYILTNDYNYYILDPELTKQIFKDSPILFSAGKMKEDFFNKTMPNNLGIAKCLDVDNVDTITNLEHRKCPWKKLRLFNENVLGTKKETPFFNCIEKIINQYIKTPLLTIDDFYRVSNNIVCHSIFGGNGKNLCVYENIHNQFINNDDVLNTEIYQKYINHLHTTYQEEPECSLAKYVNKYKNDKLDIIDDQIPHWAIPFRFIINYLIPNLLCIILNFEDIYTKLITEIRHPNFDINSKTSYLHYCIIEHIRVFSTININTQRTVNKTMNYHGMKLKKGDQLFMLFSSILRNSKDFPDPDTFKPNRWKNKDINSQDFVFGVGPQQCPSKKMTPIYYKQIIYHLLTKFNYKSVTPKLKNKKIYFINPYTISFKV